MAPDNENELERIFHEALQRTTSGERTAFLDGACGGDLHLRARVDVLLKAHLEAEGFLEDGVAGPDEATISEGAGSIIGNFKLLQKIGEGGMGAVYMAEQQRPVQRKVALKIIKLGMDTKQVIARFEAERQALAMMDHPSIAKVLDAGATDTGRPYFVMELVRGVPIGEYCDTHNLSTGARLGLFIDVCRALQHAHQKGIIHRDIKPSNVLVTSHDGVPVPKIIDFGVAKATNQRLTEMTLFTEYHQFIGTPEYMSPEQAEMSGLDIDTRSDVYSLGVLLYHLLTGTTPIDAQTIREAGYENIQRLIREQEATAPSTLISKMGNESTDIAKRRGTEPRVLQSLFRGDLDWIVMKALEKDRTRRYETVSAMADDVQRHLDNQPVLAGRPSTLYKFSKFVRRNKVAVLAGSVASTALVVGLAAALIGFWRARDEARRSQLISDTLQDLLVSVDPGQAASMQVDVESVLARAREAFGDGHATVAATLNSLAVQLQNSGNPESAEPLYEESLRIWEQTHGRDHLNVALTLGRLGTVQRETGDPDKALTTLRDAVEIAETLPASTELATCSIRVDLAELLASRGEQEEAKEQFEDAVAIYSRARNTNRHLLMNTIEKYATVLLPEEDADRLLELTEQLYDEVRVAYPNGGVYSLATASGLGNRYYLKGQTEKALVYLREAVYSEGFDRHPFRMRALDNMFQILRGRTDPEGVTEANEVLAEFLRCFGQNFSAWERLGNMNHLAGRLFDNEQYTEALEWMHKGFQLTLEAGGDARQVRSQADQVATIAMSIAMLAGRERDDYQAARDAVEELLLEDPDDTAYRIVLGALLYRLGRIEEAADVYAAIDLVHDERRARVEAAKAGFHALILHSLGDHDSAGVFRTRMEEAPQDSSILVRALVAQLSDEVREVLDRRN